METEKKICTKCGELKELSEFYFNKTRNTYRADCKECVKDKQHKYYKENTEQILKQKKEYNIKNKDIIKEKKQIHRLKNKDIIKEKKHISYVKNKDKINKKCREYRLKNRDTINKRLNKYYYENKDKLNKQKKDKRESDKQKQVLKYLPEDFPLDERDTPTHLYIVKHNSLPIFKIGYSKYLDRRLHEINRDFGESTLLHYITTSNCRTIERSLNIEYEHLKYNNFNENDGNGYTEWFYDDCLEEVLDKLKQNKKR
jgi:hypothetical protein